MNRGQSRGALGRTLAGFLIVAGLAAAAVALVQVRPDPAIAPRADRPVLMLLTSLPIVFPETFGLEGGGSPALAALEKRYTVVPIGAADGKSLSQGSLLLAAQPQAQPAEVLAELDKWVRNGGRMLLLADPALDWHSERPLGDPLRPPAAFADTGLLAHWGLRLDAPDERGPKALKLGKHDVLTASPGALAGTCDVTANKLAARCAIGRGEATVIADADFLAVDQLDGPITGNLPALLDELARLEAK